MNTKDINIILALREIAQNSPDKDIQNYGHAVCNSMAVFGVKYIYNILALMPDNYLIKPYYTKAKELLQ